jgi:hypothetical protein
MQQLLQAAIDSGDLQVINMHKDGDGLQILELFTRPTEKVLRKLIGDLRLAGHQHFAFHEYNLKDPHGNRLFASDANGSVSFQLAQIKIGPDKVPVSIVLYIDGTFLKKGIPIQPVYSENCTLYRVRYRVRLSRYRIRYLLYSSDIVHDIVCSMESGSVLAVGCLNNERSVLAKTYDWRPLAPSDLERLCMC